MKKTIQVLIIFSFLIFNSCSTDDDSYSLPMAGNECRIVERIFSINDYKYIYHYDDLDRLIIKEKYKEDTLIDEWEYVYNGSTVNANNYYFYESRTFNEGSSHSVFLNSNGSVNRRESRSTQDIYLDPSDTTPVTIVFNHTYKYDEKGYLMEDTETIKYYDAETGEFMFERKTVRERTIVDGNLQTLVESTYYDYDEDIFREVKTEYSYSNDSGNMYSGELFLGTPNKNLVNEVKIYEDGILNSHMSFSYVLDENSNIIEKTTEYLDNDRDPFTTFYNWDCN